MNIFSIIFFFLNSSSLWCYGALIICFHKKLSPTMVDRLLILIWITFNNSVQKLTLIYHHIDFDRLGKLCSLINILMILRQKIYTYAVNFIQISQCIFKFYCHFLFMCLRFRLYQCHAGYIIRKTPLKLILFFQNLIFRLLDM